MKSGPVLIVPALEKGRGGGHLARSLFLVRSLCEKGRDVRLWIPEALKGDAAGRLSVLSGPDGGFYFSRFLSRREELENRSWAFILLDSFKTPPREFSRWAALGPVIGIDEGGPRRNRFDFLIDLLPALPSAPANFTAPRFLPLPRRRRPTFFGHRERNVNGRSNQGEEDEKKPFRILISFGAEDPAGLGFPVALALAAGGSGKESDSKAGEKITAMEITLVAPSSSGAQSPALRGVRVVPGIPALGEHLAEYDLFISHFGLGAFEALYARVPVLLVSPTAYHQKLSRNAGFPSAGKGTGNTRLLGRRLGRWLGQNCFTALARQCEAAARRFGLEKDQTEDIAGFITKFVPRIFRTCPACGESGTAGNTGERNTAAALARFGEASYYRCPVCGMIYQSRLTPPSIEYEKDYFFDFYKRQYGKTYLEDFPNLMEMARRRLARIRPLLSFGSAPSAPDRGKPALLDIGCAYGPFLAAAAQAGFSPAGVEPAADAVRYVCVQFGFSVWQGFFPQALPPGVRFDAVTLWYVIEHFEEPRQTLKAIHAILKTGGVLALATPSRTGISGRKSLRAFLRQSPPDHWTVWSPRTCRFILKQHGFAPHKIVVSGHHPERFPLLGPLAKQKKGPLYQVLLALSRLFRLGDTFEAYAVKI